MNRNLLEVRYGDGCILKRDPFDLSVWQFLIANSRSCRNSFKLGWNVGRRITRKHAQAKRLMCAHLLKMNAQEAISIIDCLICFAAEPQDMHRRHSMLDWKLSYIGQIIESR